MVILGNFFFFFQRDWNRICVTCWCQAMILGFLFLGPVEESLSFFIFLFGKNIFHKETKKREFFFVCDWIEIILVLQWPGSPMAKYCRDDILCMMWEQILRLAVKCDEPSSNRRPHPPRSCRVPRHRTLVSILRWLLQKLQNSIELQN